MQRPRLDVDAFEIALNQAELESSELEIIDHIRYMGIFDELSLRKALALPSKPPALYRLNKACEKIAVHLPEQSQALLNWSHCLLNIDINKIEAAITSRTKAISIVHFLGMPVNMHQIMAIAKKHDLFVVEDSALAVGSYCDGHHVG